MYDIYISSVMIAADIRNEISIIPASRDRGFTSDTEIKILSDPTARNEKYKTGITDPIRLKISAANLLVLISVILL